MFKQRGVNLYHKPFNNLRKQLSHVKGKTPTLKRCSMIYDVKCCDYDHDNVGETAQGTRLKENQTRTSSVIHELCSTSCHSITPDNVTHLVTPLRLTMMENEDYQTSMMQFSSQIT